MNLGRRTGTLEGVGEGKDGNNLKAILIVWSTFPPPKELKIETIKKLDKLKNYLIYEF